MGKYFGLANWLDSPIVRALRSNNRSPWGVTMKWNFGRASDDESLRLVVAFMQIHEPDKRLQLVAMAERLQQESKPLPKPCLAVRQDNAPGSDGSV
jgi:hypothetical protein